MSKELTPHEWQTLSAYIDGQLPDRERQKLEARLKADSEMREDLDDLRRTRTLLRTLPKRKAPRNFTLTRAMVPQRLQSNPFPVFRLVSALASFLLVLAFVGDLTFSSSVASMTQQEASLMQAADSQQYEAPQAAAPLLGATAPEATAKESWATPSEPSEFSGGQADGLGGGGGGGDGTSTGASATDEGFALQEQLQANALGTPAPTLDATQQAIVAQTLAPPGMGEASAQANETPSTLMAIPQESTPAPETLRSMGVPTAANGAEASTGPSISAETTAETGSPANIYDPRSILRPLEVGLGIVAVITAILALYYRGKISS